MYIIGGLIAMLFMAMGSSFEFGNSQLNIIKQSLGDKATYLGLDRTKKKHVFAMPYGSDVDCKKLEKIIGSFIGRKVECEFNRYLYVQILHDLVEEVPLPSGLKKNNRKVLIGEGYHGKVYHNFMKYPHMIIAGHTGYGKTNFIKSLLAQLDGEIVLIDLKRSDDFHRVTAKTINETAVVLNDIVDHMPFRNRKKEGELFVVVDEAFVLLPPKFVPKKEQTVWLKCQEAVFDIAMRGRSAGVHLLFCTQYPIADVVPGHIKQNCETRVVFRLPTEVGSRVALDEEGAELLPAGVYGRAVYKNDTKVEIQTYLMNDKEGDDWYVKIRDSQTQRTSDIIEVR